MFILYTKLLYDLNYITNMNNKIIILICVVILILAGAVSAFVFTNTQEESSLTITSNETLYDGENCTVKLTNKEGVGIANKTINVTLTSENGSNTNVTYITNNEGIISFNISEVGNYSVKCVFNGDNDYKSSNTSTNVNIISKVVVQTKNNDVKDISSKKSSSSKSNYYEDDHLSCEELKAKYPEMTDGELFEKFGERGEDGIMYDGHHVWEDRGDGKTYSGHPI